MKQPSSILTLLLLSCMLSSLASAQQKKSALSNHETLKPGQVLHSINGLFTLQFQQNSLVVLNKKTVVWHSKNWSTGKNQIKIDKLQFENGELKAYFNQKITWSSHTAFNHSSLIVGNDGILKIVSEDKDVLWENFAGTARSIKPPLVSGGDEGQFTDSMMQPTNKIHLYVLFIDWPDAKAITNDFDSIWNGCTSNGELFKAFKQQGRAINLSVEPHLVKKWQTLPQPTSYYFPPSAGEGKWNWTGYITDCPALLPAAFGVDSFSNNSIVVVVPTATIGDRWTKGVPSGNHLINFHGIRSLISLHPVERQAYRTLMHEMGHSYGSGELYATPNDDAVNTEMFGLDMMGNDYFATGFMGYHRYRYGWMPFDSLKPAGIYLTQRHSYGITLTPLSNDHGIHMVLIPDAAVSAGNLQAPHKLWGIEIGQEVQSMDQFNAGKNEKMFAEGDNIIIYSVDARAEPGKREIRLISKTGKQTQPDERWSKVFLYKDGDTFQHVAAPMDVKIYRNADGSFYLDVKMK